MLKYIMESLEGLSPELAALYTKGEDGKFVLTGVEGVSPKTKVDEFRANNIALTNRLNAFGDITAEQAKKLVSENSELKIKLDDTGKSVDDKAEQIAKARIEAYTAEYAEKMNNLEAANAELTSSNNSMVLNMSIDKHAINHKALPEAIEDIKLRAATVFKVENGSPVAYNGKDKMMQADGVTPVTMDSWVKGLVTTSPHLFQPSEGSGMPRGRGAHGADRSKMSPVQKIMAGL